eukprot:TRINITY_DN229_c0_g1_i2.p8 TRINITY_DN229_c0_g1~~TRINITY_DN229_c0_g1_i2.p8  ORF type:complete len:119 (-),score=14.38 TRINITY_DN229_c0_g1_i2:1441-1797(-)
MYAVNLAWVITVYTLIASGLIAAIFMLFVYKRNDNVAVQAQLLFLYYVTIMTRFGSPLCVYYQYRQITMEKKVETEEDKFREQIKAWSTEEFNKAFDELQVSKPKDAAYAPLKVFFYL